eukprot:s1358_g9.t1
MGSSYLCSICQRLIWSWGWKLRKGIGDEATIFAAKVEDTLWKAHFARLDLEYLLRSDGFVLSSEAEVKMRPLPFAVVADIEAAINGMKPPGIFAVAHSHLRGLSAEDRFSCELQDREGIINGNTEAENLRCMLQKQPKELREILLASGMME